MDKITSVNNQLVKDVHSLKQKKYRTQSGTFLVEGLRAVEEALRYGSVDRLFVTEDEESRCGDLLNLAASESVETFLVDSKVMGKLADTKNPQGIAATVRMPDKSLDSLLHSPAGNEDNLAPVVVLDRIQDPGNMGTIIRTADASGALGVVVLEGCVDVYSPKVVRASMGSLFHLPVISDCTPEEMLTWCCREGYLPAAACLDGASSLYRTDLCRKVAFILGNEANGVSPELQQAAELKLLIPMPGLAESMNVAMAGGVILYESLRQRRKL